MPRPARGDAVQGFSLDALPAKAEALDSGRTTTYGVAPAPPRERPSAIMETV